VLPPLDPTELLLVLPPVLPAVLPPVLEPLTPPELLALDPEPLLALAIALEFVEPVEPVEPVSPVEPVEPVELPVVPEPVVLDVVAGHTHSPVKVLQPFGAHALPEQKSSTSQKPG
jgi:hypothetical protein